MAAMTGAHLARLVRWLAGKGYSNAEIAACIAEVRNEAAPTTAALQTAMGQALVAETELCFGLPAGYLAPKK